MGAHWQQLGQSRTRLERTVCQHDAMPPKFVTSPGGPRVATARTKLLVSVGAAIVGGAAAAVAGASRAAPLIGWDILALVFGGWVWSTVWRLDAESTTSDAMREDPSRDLADLVLLSAAMASLIAVGVVLIAAGHASGDLKYLQAAFGLASVFVSWALVHTVFTLKYARLYYTGQAGGIDFNETDRPQYSDFAYLEGYSPGCVEVQSYYS